MMQFIRHIKIGRTQYYSDRQTDRQTGTLKKFNSNAVLFEVLSTLQLLVL